MNLYNKKRTGEIVVALPKTYYRTKDVYVLSFHPSGESSWGLQTPTQFSKNFGKHPVNWKNGGNKLFLQLIFYPTPIGHNRENKDKALKYILKAEFKNG